MTFERGARFPHLRIRRLDGSPWAYEDIWQHRGLLLVALGRDTGAGGADLDGWIASIGAQAPAFDAYKTTVVVTRDEIDGLTTPAVVVVDRWGEVMAVELWDAEGPPPDVPGLVEWTRFVAQACPECEAEAR